MAQRLSIFSGRQFIDANGDPYVGAKLFTYLAGSATKTTTTKDSAGLSDHANPIILNSRGEPGDGAGAAQAIWHPEGTTLKYVLAPSGDTDPPVSAISTWDNVPGVNDTSITDQGQWVLGPTPTYVGATSFTLIGDQTSDFHVGRRIKTTNSGGTIYSLITVSAYTSLTTVTVVNDSGVLDSGLSAVSYGLLTSDNPSVPGDLTKIRKLDASGLVRFSKGSDIASATELPHVTDGNYSDVTGTTTITSIATTGQIGTVIKRHFDGILTLTHHATDLILPGSANITTAAGDEAEFIEYASGDFICTNYNRADGTAVVATGLNIVDSSFSSGLWYQGTGDDGSKTVAASENLARGEYHYTDLTVSAGQTLGVSNTSGGLIIRCTGAVTINNTAIISVDGKGGPGGVGVISVAGAAGTDGILGGAGGSGGNDGFDSGKGGDVTIRRETLAGGASKTGGAGAGSGGSSLAAATRIIRTLTSYGDDLLGIYGGGGGGAGTGGTTTPGDGGAGGGFVIIIADSIDFQTGATITADGVNGSNNANDGGGGGGGGGFVLLAARTITNNGTITVTGGTGGTGISGYNGGAGGAGHSIVITG